jgi:hypothetical protein
VHVMVTGLMCALATAYRRPCEQADTGRAPVGWQRWRRQLLEQTRDHVIVVAQDCYGIVHMAEYSLLGGVQRKDVPPGIGTRQEILAKFGLSPPWLTPYPNFRISDCISFTRTVPPFVLTLDNFKGFLVTRN